MFTWKHSSEFRFMNEDYEKQVPPFKSSRPIHYTSDTLHLWICWPSLERQMEMLDPGIVAEMVNKIRIGCQE